mmetsp:Transcript_13426/g.32352  ORF Transcript_13426/g.32352 Transcript_13426/m.32352 type:complete len:203 (-) Transcript_13426:870-1478(-)
MYLANICCCSLKRFCVSCDNLASLMAGVSIPNSESCSSSGENCKAIPELTEPPKELDVKSDPCASSSFSIISAASSCCSSSSCCCSTSCLSNSRRCLNSSSSLISRSLASRINCSVVMWSSTSLYSTLSGMYSFRISSMEETVLSIKTQVNSWRSLTLKMASSTFSPISISSVVRFRCCRCWRCCSFNSPSRDSISFLNFAK